MRHFDRKQDFMFARQVDAHLREKGFQGKRGLFVSHPGPFEKYMFLELLRCLDQELLDEKANILGGIFFLRRILESGNNGLFGHREYLKTRNVFRGDD